MKKNWKPLLIGISCTALSAVIITGCGKSDDDSSDLALNSPYRRGHEGNVMGVTNYAELINNYGTGKPKREPWAAHWWPYTANGIAASTSGGSPAGKYDAARGGTTHA